jgi:N-methylhydantoinase B
MMERASPKTDPVTFEVIRHKLSSIIDAQTIALKSVSGSPIVTEACDFNTGLFGTDGSLVVMGMGILIHIGTLSQVLQHILIDWEDQEIHEEDMFIVNNPYQGAAHQSDVSIVAPIFYQGKRVGWSGACAHQLDMGGAEYSSWNPKATEIYQEAMIIPPVKIVERGKIRKDIWKMIMTMSRLPFMIGLDFKAMIAANNVASQRLKEMIERFGPEPVLDVMDGVVEHSESALRRRLSELPDGRYRSQNFLDHDGHQNRLYRIGLTVTKQGDAITFDFSETSPQAPGFVNCTRSGMIGAIFSGLLPILAFDIPWNSGLLKPVRVIAPEGILCNATWPAPVGSATVAAAIVVENTVVEALSRMVARSEHYATEAQAVSEGSFDVLHLGGLNQYGEPFGTAFLDPLAGGSGAYPDADGIDTGGIHMVATPSIANVETNENFAPILYLHRKMVPDTGGAGRRRGGRSAGLAFVAHDTEALVGVLVCHGVESPNAHGLSGGYPGSCNRNVLIRQSDLRAQWKAGKWPTSLEEILGERVPLEAKHGRIVFTPSDVFEFTWQGGGGVGDPLEREPERVAQDVERDAVLREEARRIYGVVLDEKGRMNRRETEELRGGIRKARKERPRTKWLARAIWGERTGTLGGGIEILDEGGERFTACSCGFALGPLQENWKEYATRATVPARAAGPWVILHHDLELREFACPGCGKLLSVEVAQKGDSLLWEVEAEVRALDPPAH